MSKKDIKYFYLIYRRVITVLYLRWVITYCVQSGDHRSVRKMKNGYCVQNGDIRSVRIIALSNLIKMSLYSSKSVKIWLSYSISYNNYTLIIVKLITQSILACFTWVEACFNHIGKCYHVYRTEATVLYA